LGTLEGPVTIIFEQNVSGLEKVLIETAKSLLARMSVRVPV
jgi:hypothetical protein